MSQMYAYKSNTMRHTCLKKYPWSTIPCTLHVWYVFHVFYMILALVGHWFSNKQVSHWHSVHCPWSWQHHLPLIWSIIHICMPHFTVFGTPGSLQWFPWSWQHNHILLLCFYHVPLSWFFFVVEMVVPLKMEQKTIP